MSENQKENNIQLIPQNNKEYFPLPNELNEMIIKNFELLEQFNVLVKEQNENLILQEKTNENIERLSKLKEEIQQIMDQINSLEKNFLSLIKIIIEDYLNEIIEFQKLLFPMSLTQKWREIALGECKNYPRIKFDKKNKLLVYKYDSGNGTGDFEFDIEKEAKQQIKMTQMEYLKKYFAEEQQKRNKQKQQELEKKILSMDDVPEDIEFVKIISINRKTNEIELEIDNNGGTKIGIWDLSSSNEVKTNILDLQKGLVSMNFLQSSQNIIKEFGIKWKNKEG